MKHIALLLCCMGLLLIGQAQAAVPLVSTEKLQPPQSPFFYSSDKDSEVWGIRNPKPQNQPGWNIPSPNMPYVPLPIIIMPDKQPVGKPAPVQPIVR